MSDPELFSRLLANAKEGDVEALSQLVELYQPEVLMVARKKLSNALRQHLDSVDLVQSVHKSILVGLTQDRFDISSPEKLIALAVTIVRRKAARHWRRNQRQKNFDIQTDDARVIEIFLLELQSNAPSEQSALELQESIQNLLGKLDLDEKKLIEFRMQGFSTAEMARKTGLDADVLRVKLSRLRKKLRLQGISNDLL